MTSLPQAKAPSLLTEMHSAEIPAVYRRFADVVGAKNWMRRVALVKGEIRHNRFLEAYLHEENEIAFGLAACENLIARYNGLPNDAVARRVLYPALSFAAQVLSLMDLSTPVEAKRLRMRVIGALRNPDDVRALRLELTVATHFARRGHTLQWPEMVGGGTFDLLVTDMARDGVEVECKSVANDKGRKIHRRDALEFHHLLNGELSQVRETLKSGLSVVLTLPGRLPTRHADRRALAKCVQQQIIIGHSTRLEDGSDIRIKEFDETRLGNIANDGLDERVRPVIDDVTGTRNRECMLRGTQAGGALAFVVQSAGEDDFLDTTFKTLSDAAKRQLSRTRPALLIAGFDGLDGDQLISIAQQDFDASQQPTALAIKVSRFLAADHRDYVVGVAFLSRGALRPVTDRIVDSSGTAYYFPRRESPFWHDDLGGLFESPNTPSASLPAPSVAV